MVVACGGYGEAEQILIIVHCLDHGAEEEQELSIFVRRCTGGEQVDARVGLYRPVVVLARAVDSRKGLFMKQADETVLFCNALHKLHCELVVVGGYVRGREYGSQLVLCGRDLVVLCLGKHAEVPQLLVEILHELAHARFYGAEVMVVKLLTLGRLCAEQRASGKYQIAALVEHILVDEEVFLLGTDRRFYRGHIGVAEKTQNAHCLTVERFHRAEQGSFLVKRLAAV